MTTTMAKALNRIIRNGGEMAIAKGLIHYQTAHALERRGLVKVLSRRERRSRYSHNVAAVTEQGRRAAR